VAASVAFSQNRCVCCLSRVEKPEFCQLEASTQKRYSHDVQKLAHKVTNHIIRFMYLGPKYKESLLSTIFVTRKMCTLKWTMGSKKIVKLPDRYCNIYQLSQSRTIWNHSMMVSKSIEQADDNLVYPKLKMFHLVNEKKL
jgi:hypothetical protein